MALDQHELAKLTEIGEAVVRIDERTERMDLEYTRRFSSVHKRIDEVRNDTKDTTARTAGTLGLLAGLSALVRQMFFGE